MKKFISTAVSCLLFLCISSSADAGLNLERRVQIPWVNAHPEGLLRLSGDSFVLVSGVVCFLYFEPCPLELYYFKDTQSSPQLIAEFPAGEKILELPNGQGYLIQSGVAEFTELRMDASLGRVHPLGLGGTKLNINRCIVTAASLLVCPHKAEPMKDYSYLLSIYDLKFSSAPKILDTKIRFGSGSFLLPTDDGFLVSHYKTDMLAFYKNDLSLDFERKMERPRDYVISAILSIPGGALVHYYNEDNSQQAFVHVKGGTTNQVYRFDLNVSTACRPSLFPDSNRNHFFFNCAGETFRLTNQGQVTWRVGFGYSRPVGANRILSVRHFSGTYKYEYSLLDSRDGSLLGQIELGSTGANHFQSRAITVRDQVVIFNTPGGYYERPSPLPKTPGYESEVLILNE